MDTATAAPATPPPALDFDAVRWWKRLSTHLDSLPLGKVADALGLATVIRKGTAGPVQCPRLECRSPLPFFDGDSWACWQCGVLGRGAALFVAHVVGWTATDGEDDLEVRREFGQLAFEALFCGLVDASDPSWQAFYDAIPGSKDWTAGQRGIFQGDDRPRRLRELAAQLLKLDVPARGIYRLVWAWNCTYCQPPLPAREVAGVMATALRPA